MLAVCACAGCRTADYSAHNLPLALQAPLVTKSAGINLEQMAGDGVGTSEICPGDLVTITIMSGNTDEKAAPTPARVAQDGTVMVPLIGESERLMESLFEALGESRHSDPHFFSITHCSGCWC